MAAKLMTMEDELKEKVKVHTDFKSFLRSIEVTALREAWIDGLLPREIVIDELKRRGVIKEDTDFAELMNMLQNERDAWESFQTNKPVVNDDVE